MHNFQSILLNKGYVVQNPILPKKTMPWYFSNHLNAVQMLKIRRGYQSINRFYFLCALHGFDSIFVWFVVVVVVVVVAWFVYGLLT